MAHFLGKTLALTLIVGVLISIAISSPLFGETDDFAPLVGDLVPGDSGVHAETGTNRGCGRPGGPGGPGGPPPPPNSTTTASSG